MASEAAATLELVLKRRDLFHGSTISSTNALVVTSVATSRGPSNNSSSSTAAVIIIDDSAAFVGIQADSSGRCALPTFRVQGGCQPNSSNRVCLASNRALDPAFASSLSPDDVGGSDTSFVAAAASFGPSIHYFRSSGAPLRTVATSCTESILHLACVGRKVWAASSNAIMLIDREREAWCAATPSAITAMTVTPMSFSSGARCSFLCIVGSADHRIRVLGSDGTILAVSPLLVGPVTALAEVPTNASPACASTANTDTQAGARERASEPSLSATVSAAPLRIVYYGTANGTVGQLRVSGARELQMQVIT